MGFKNGELSPAEKLYGLIDRVVIVKGRLSTDPAVWEFHIGDEVLKVETGVLEKPKAFRNQYLSIFDRPAPMISSSDWINLLDNLADEENNKVEHKEAPEESNNEFIARQIFEIVCDNERELSDDPEEALTGRSLFKHTLKEDNTLYYCLPSDVLKNIVDSAGYKILPKELSTAMTELGFKKDGTQKVWYNGIQKRSWCFIPEAVLRERGEFNV